MNQTFVCCTTYHLYISILEGFKYKTEGKKNILVFIIDKITDSDRIISILNKIDVFENIIPIKAYVITNEMSKKMGIFNFLFNRSSTLVKLIESENENLLLYDNFFNQSEFNLFITNRTRAYFLIKYPNTFMRMHEDGLAAYTKQITKLRVFIRKYVLRFPLLKGYDEQVKEFWVQQPEKIKDKVLKPKLRRLDLQVLEDAIKFDQKKLILKSFLGDTIFKAENRALIITQPLSEIGMMTEQKKIDIYRGFVSNARLEGLTVYIKVHPAELTNYNEVFKNQVIVLPSVFPLEIFNLSNDFHFKKAFTVHSSALGNLKYIDEKIFSDKFGRKIYN